MNLHKVLIFSIAAAISISGQAQVPSKSWNPDMDNEYRNPILNADYSDPDVCRVGDDFYMTSSSFCSFPGLQILHSTDLVNWELIGAALTDYPGSSWEEDVEKWHTVPQHGNGVWAPAIRYHNGEFYIYCGDPDRGIFMVKTTDPRGKWEAPVWVVKAKGFIEFVSMLAMAVPGTVLGVGFIRGFAGGVFRTGFLQGIYGTGVILVIVFVVRSLPVGTRSGISALRQIDKSIEESAYDLGAGSAKVFMTVTLPLIKDSFLSGLVTAFVRSITAISAIILLVTPSFLLITVQINEFAEKGAFSIACAFATILILITYGAVLLMNLVMKFFGTSRKLKEED